VTETIALLKGGLTVAALWTSLVLRDGPVKEGGPIHIEIFLHDYRSMTDLDIL
jgi:hypothetical protein